MSRGRIIFLNGPSSVGKTEIAKALQPLLARPYLHVGVDMFYQMMPRRYFGKDPGGDDPAYQGFRWRTVKTGDETWYDLTPGPLGYRLLAGMQQAVAAMASVGNNIILDENVIYEGQLEGYLAALRDFAILFVGVRCSLEETLRRERQRGDRRIGHARGHYYLTHALVDAHGSYDLDVDTSHITPLEGARLIMHRLHSPPLPRAFSRLGDALLTRR